MMACVTVCCAHVNDITRHSQWTSEGKDFSSALVLSVSSSPDDQIAQRSAAAGDCQSERV